MLMTIMIADSQRKKLKIVDFVASYLMNHALSKVPKASEPKIANTHIELAKNIWDSGNHKLGNFVEALIIKQNPNEQRKVPRQKK